jgi:hypothetical protein
LIGVTVGIVDTAIDRQWDVLAVLCVIGFLQLILLTQLHAHRPPVPIRADLVKWLRARAGMTDEDPGHLADRAVAAYRAGLTGELAAPEPKEPPE